VYNLEVEGEHEYLVSDLGVRSHNSAVAGCPGLSDASIAKLNDLDYVASLSARLSQRALRHATRREGLSGAAAGRRAEALFDGYSGRLNDGLSAAESPFRIRLQQAARANGPRAGNRVTAWNARGRGGLGGWRHNTKRLDWIIEDVRNRATRSGLRPAVVGADMTVTRGGAKVVPAEYRQAFPNTRLIGIDPDDIVGL
jgi:hypothetical protein